MTGHALGNHVSGPRAFSARRGWAPKVGARPRLPRELGCAAAMLEGLTDALARRSCYREVTGAEIPHGSTRCE